MKKNKKLPKLEEMPKMLKKFFKDKDNIVALLLKAHLITEYYMDKILYEFLGAKKEPFIKLDLIYSKKNLACRGF